jgi:hypothetical protein
MKRADAGADANSDRQRLGSLAGAAPTKPPIILTCHK